MSTSQKIVSWLKDYAESADKDGYVVGISGGIDSSLTSTLCALTGKELLAIRMPIHQLKNQDDLSKKHGKWLEENFSNVKVLELDLTSAFDSFASLFKEENKSSLSLANTRSRMRMIALYQFASTRNALVAGTGNKVEDFGVGFYTKYGDGGVDISPIADCTKTQVWEMGKSLGIIKEILDAEPTDGLWEDGRTDIKQLGMSYEELEEAMKDKNSKGHSKYLEIRKRNLHKMKPIPVCMMDDE